MKVKVIVATVGVVGSLCVSASAAPLNGVFDVSGFLTLSSAGIAWTQPASGPEKSLIQGTPTGSFSGMAGDLVTIHDLSFVTDPVGVTFALQPFISFDTAPAFTSLDIGSIFSGIYGAAECAALPATVGQACTPSAPYTFLNLVNNPPPAPAGPQATLTFVLSGVTSDGLSDWQANVTSQFAVPYQTLLAQLASSNFLTSTYSATVTVTARNGNIDPTPTPVPEPASLVLVGSGVIGLVTRRRRLRP